MEILYYAVYNENNLGYLYTLNNSKYDSVYFGFLRASILRGSTYNELSGPLIISDYDTGIRKATPKDFDDYMISFPKDFFDYN